MTSKSDGLKIAEEERQKDITRWRTFLGLDPNAPPSFNDLNHVNQLVKDMQTGKRPDLAPPGYDHNWSIASYMPQEVPTETNEDVEMEPPVSLLSAFNISGNSKKDSPDCLDLLSPCQNLSQSPLPEEILQVLEEPTDPKRFAEQLQMMRERREKELQTKEGRSKWDKFESGEPGHPPPGFYKAVKEMKAQKRHKEKLDWNLLQEAIKEYRQRVSDGREKPPTETGKGKGKKGKR